MITCSEVRPLLIELVFGDLDSVEEMRVNQHLLACSACRGEEAELVELKNSARRAVSVVPGPSLRARIEAALPPARARAARGLGRPVPAYVAVAAALLGAFLAAALPLRLSALKPSERSVGRAARVVQTGREARFTVADSYDTRVRAASPTTE